MKLTVDKINAKVGKQVDPRTVRQLDLSKKQIDELGTFISCIELRRVNFSGNRFRTLKTIDGLYDARKLKTLDFTGCPVQKQPHYRLTVIANLPRLRNLDGAKITMTERFQAYNMFPDKKPPNFNVADVISSDEEEAEPEGANVESVENVEEEEGENEAKSKEEERLTKLAELAGVSSLNKKANQDKSKTSEKENEEEDEEKEKEEAEKKENESKQKKSIDLDKDFEKPPSLKEKVKPIVTKKSGDPLIGFLEEDIFGTEKRRKSSGNPELKPPSNVTNPTPSPSTSTAPTSITRKTSRKSLLFDDDDDDIFDTSKRKTSDQPPKPLLSKIQESQKVEPQKPQQPIQQQQQQQQPQPVQQPIQQPTQKSQPQQPQQPQQPIQKPQQPIQPQKPQQPIQQQPTQQPAQQKPTQQKIASLQSKWNPFDDDSDSDSEKKRVPLPKPQPKPQQPIQQSQPQPQPQSQPQLPQRPPQQQQQPQPQKQPNQSQPQQPSQKAQQLPQLPQRPPQQQQQPSQKAQQQQQQPQSQPQLPQRPPQPIQQPPQKQPIQQSQPPKPLQQQQQPPLTQTKPPQQTKPLPTPPQKVQQQPQSQPQGTTQPKPQVQQKPPQQQPQGTPPKPQQIPYATIQTQPKPQQTTSKPEPEKLPSTQTHHDEDKTNQKTPPPPPKKSAEIKLKTLPMILPTNPWDGVDSRSIPIPSKKEEVTAPQDISIDDPWQKPSPPKNITKQSTFDSISSSSVWQDDEISYTPPKFDEPSHMMTTSLPSSHLNVDLTSNVTLNSKKDYSLPKYEDDDIFSKKEEPRAPFEDSSSRDFHGFSSSTKQPPSSTLPSYLSDSDPWGNSFGQTTPAPSKNLDSNPWETPKQNFFSPSMDDLDPWKH